MLSTTIGIANQVSFCIVDASRSLRYCDPEESESHVLSPQVFGDTKRDPPHPARHSVFRQHLTSGDYLQSLPPFGAAESVVTLEMLLRVQTASNITISLDIILS
jgi:hypothetical protein